MAHNRMIVLLVFNPRRTKVWTAKVDDANLPDGVEPPCRMTSAAQSTVPSFRKYFSDVPTQQDTRDAAKQLFKDVFGMEPIDEQLMWLEDLKHYFIYGVESPVYDEYSAYIYTAKECELLEATSDKAAKHWGYTSPTWVATNAIYNLPYDTDLAPYQPLWMLRQWVWFGQRAGAMADLAAATMRRKEESEHGQQ